MPTSQRKPASASGDFFMQARIELFKKRDAEAVARQMGYSPDAFSKAYTNHFSVTPQEDLASNSGTSNGFHQGIGGGVGSQVSESKLGRGYRGRSRRPSSKGHASFF